MADIDLACIGSCCMDVIMHVNDVFRFDMRAPDFPDVVKEYTAIEYSSKLNVKSLKFTPGGSAANVAVNLKHIGLQTSYIGKLGDEFMGKMAIEDMKQAGVQLESCFTTDEDKTGLSVILITPFGKDRSILAYKGANDLIRPAEINDEWLHKARHLQWTSLTSQSGVDSIEKCIDIVKGHGGTIFACPSISIMRNNLEGARRLVSKSDVLLLNKEELAALTGHERSLLGLKKALSMGPSMVACTNGGAGVKVTDGHDMIVAPVYEVDVVDTTGAGDAFASGFIYAYMNNKDMETMIKFGSAMAMFECSVLGVRDGIPREAAAVEEFIAKTPMDLVTTHLDDE